MRRGDAGRIAAPDHELRGARVEVFVVQVKRPGAERKVIVRLPDGHPRTGRAPGDLVAVAESSIKLEKRSAP